MTENTEHLKTPRFELHNKKYTLRVPSELSDEVVIHFADEDTGADQKAILSIISSQFTGKTVAEMTRRVS